MRVGGRGGKMSFVCGARKNCCLDWALGGWLSSVGGWEWG